MSESDEFGGLSYEQAAAIIKQGLAQEMIRAAESDRDREIGTDEEAQAAFLGYTRQAMQSQTFRDMVSAMPLPAVPALAMMWVHGLTLTFLETVEKTMPDDSVRGVLIGVGGKETADGTMVFRPFYMAYSSDEDIVESMKGMPVMTHDPEEANAYARHMVERARMVRDSGR